MSNTASRRRAGSLSSSDLSPRPGARSLSSTSDDEDNDAAIPSGANDDTPPQPNRPLLRQALGFRMPPTSNNFSAFQAPQTSNQNAFAAPVAQVPTQVPTQAMPPPPPVEDQSEAKKSPASQKRRKRTDGFKAQTNRFRIDTMSPIPPVAAAINPYSSAHPAATSRPQEHHFPVENPHAQAPHPLFSSATNSSSTASMSLTTQPIQSLPPDASSSLNSTMAPNPPQRTISKSKSKKPSNAPASSSQSAASVHLRSSSNAPNYSQTSSRHHEIPPYYRRNYERNEEFLASRGQSSMGGSSHSSRKELQQRSSISSGAEPQGRPSASSATSRQPPRMVTLLIQDVRRGDGTTDYQLAEIKIYIKPTDDPRDGFWADAKELSDKLQGGPSRIDGPAKVYTLRGHYRQFFLRVTADNREICEPANIVVSPERTVEVIVEPLHDPGRPLSPLRLPRGLPSVSPEPEHRYPSMDIDANYRHTSMAMDHARKRRLTPSPDNYDGQSYYNYSARRSSPTSASVTTMRDTSLPASFAGASSSSSRPSTSNSHKKFRKTVADDCMALDSGDDGFSSEEEVYASYKDAIHALIGKDPEWTEYFRASKANNPVPAVLRQYEVVQHMMDTYIGRTVLYQSDSHLIDKNDIMQEFSVDEDFCKECSETLRLLKLYGENGTRYRDDRVTALVRDSSPPAQSTKPIKRLRRLLNEIDSKWTKDHADSAG